MDVAIATVIVLLLTGILIGFTSGFLGVGGGFLMVPVQFWLLTTGGVDPTLAIRIAFGTSLAVVVPTALSSSYGHHCRQCVLTRPLFVMLVPCIFGAFLGAAISTHAPGMLMEVAFGLLLLVGSARILVSEVPGTGREHNEAVTTLILWGFVFGGVSGLFGVGGGIVMVPVMVTVMRFTMHEAIGTSTALMLGSSVAGVGSYIINGLSVPDLPAFSLGYVNVLQFLVLASASVPMAQIGVRAAHRLPGKKMRLVFVLLVGITGAYMIFSGLTR